MNTILFPTDFSEDANNALRFALEIAKRSNSKLILFNAFWVPVYDFDTPPEIKFKERKFRKESLKELKKIQESISLNFPQMDTEVLVFNGFTANAIVQASEEKGADLIVMGTKGATGLREIIMGSNTVDVLNKSNLPVLVIPEDAKNVQLSKIVFATDFHEEDKNKMNFLVKLAALFEAEITIVHVTEDDFILETADKTILQKLKKDVKVETQYEKLNYKLLKGDVLKELEAYIGENKVDLIAMVTTKKHFFSLIFEKSHTQKMAFHSKIPLLVLHG